MVGNRTRAEKQRPPLGPVSVGKVGVDLPDAAPAEPERIHGAAAVDRFPHGARHRGVRRPLPEVPRRCAAQVPARPDQDRRQPDHTGQRQDRADDDGRDDRQQDGDCGDQRLGDREAHRARERVDVGCRAGDEIACARPLDDGERQREHLAHEVLAQMREHPLREHERRAARKPGQHRLRDDGYDENCDQTVDVRGRRALLHRLDQLAEQERTDEAGDGCERVQNEHDRQRPAIQAQQDGRVPAHLRPFRDRQPLIHAASSRVTANR